MRPRSASTMLCLVTAWSVGLLALASVDGRGASCDWPCDQVADGGAGRDDAPVRCPAECAARPCRLAVVVRPVVSLVRVVAETPSTPIDNFRAPVSAETRAPPTPPPVSLG